MALVYGVKAIQQSAAAAKPHILGFATARANGDPLFQVWNDDTGTSIILDVYPDKVVVKAPIQPSTNNTRTLGTAALRWSTIYGVALDISGAATFGGVIQAPNGAVGAPAFTFASDLDCGLYRIGLNNVGAAVNGAKVLDIATTGLGVTGVLTTTSTINGQTISATAAFTGTLDAAGNFSVATNKLTVAAASGNTAIAGTLDVAGATTISLTAGGRIAAFQSTNGSVGAYTAWIATGSSRGYVGTGDQLFAAATDSFGVTAATATTPLYLGTTAGIALTFAANTLNATFAGILCIGTTVTTSAAAGELVVGYQKSIRGVNSGASDTLPLISLNQSGGLLSRAVIGGGYAGSVALQILGLANVSMPAAGADQNGIVVIDTTNNRIVYYSGGNRYFMAAGTAF